MSLQPYEHRADRERRDWIDLMRPAVELAKSVADTEFVPAAMRGNPAAITAAILYGDEIGIGPMQALAKISVIEGRPTLAAEAQRALVLAAGHELWIEEATVTRVTVAGRRRDSEQTTRVTWTMDDAKRANLAGKHNWRTYPRQMLTARATAELARAIFADVIGGLAATEEIGDDTVQEVDDTGAVISTGEEAPTRRRRRRTAATVQPAPEPAPQPDEPTPALPGEPADAEGKLVEASASLPTEDRTPGQARKLNVLVGKLRDSGRITTEHLYRALGEVRNINPDLLADLVHGKDTDGVLHWAPLRDSLNRTEADGLIERLVKLEEQVKDEPTGNAASFAQLAQLSALLHDLDIHEHAGRMTWLSEALERDVDDVAEVTPSEAQGLIARATREAYARGIERGPNDDPTEPTQEIPF